MELINDKYVDYDIKASTRCKSVGEMKEFMWNFQGGNAET